MPPAVTGGAQSAGQRHDTAAVTGPDREGPGRPLPGSSTADTLPFPGPPVPPGGREAPLGQAYREPTLASAAGSPPSPSRSTPARPCRGGGRGARRSAARRGCAPGNGTSCGSAGGSGASSHCAHGSETGSGSATCGRGARGCRPAGCGNGTPAPWQLRGGCCRRAASGALPPVRAAESGGGGGGAEAAQRRPRGVTPHTPGRQHGAVAAAFLAAAPFPLQAAGQPPADGTETPERPPGSTDLRAAAVPGKATRGAGGKPRSEMGPQRLLPGRQLTARPRCPGLPPLPRAVRGVPVTHPAPHRAGLRALARLDLEKQNSPTAPPSPTCWGRRARWQHVRSRGSSCGLGSQIQQ